VLGVAGAGWPGWLTGKLSDVAGLAGVGTLTSTAIRRGWSALGLIAAVLATTATSQSPPHYVSLGSAAGAIYASVDPGDGFDDVYLTSTDGGRSWAKATREAARSSAARPDRAG
jgi:hypothetical protein